MTISEHASADNTVMSVDNAMVLAAQLQQEGQLGRAEAILNRILQLNPFHAHALHLLGVIAHQAGKTSMGIQLIQRALMSEPRVSLFHSNQGEMYRQLQDLELSIACGQRAVTLDPHSAVALSNLGIAYYDAKNYDQAEACHKRALVLNPKQSTSLNNLGSLYKARNNVEEAIRYYRAAIASSPGYAEPINNLGAMLVMEQHFNEAIDCLNRALALLPTFVDAHCNLGFALHGINNEDSALLHFQQALQLKPCYAEAYIGLSKVHSAKNELDAAVTCAQRAIEIDPSNAAFYQCLAELYCEQGDTQQARRYFDQALAMDPTSGNTQVSKGNFLVELGESDEAERLLSIATTDQSTTTRFSAHCSLVQLRTVKPDDQSMHALLSLTASDIDHLAPSKQEYLYFSLGKCYEDLKEWSTAFEYFTKGCQLKRQRIAYRSEDATAFTLRLIENFTKDTIESLRASANPSSVPIFVLGMPRSGTTLVEQIIASHPGVYGAGELSYLTKIAHRSIDGPTGKLSYPENMHHLTPTACRAMADEYLACLQHHAPAAVRITDKMPGNFEVIGLIHALLPQAKIIHVERNPLDTCLSCYTKLFRHGQLFSYDLTELGQFYANYQRIMAHWRSILPTGSWLDVRYEHFVTDLESEAKQLIAYCGLDWDPACLDFHTTKRQVRTASFTQVRKPLYTSSVERWRRLEGELAPLIKVLTEEACI